jgi:hypothetical protein
MTVDPDSVLGTYRSDLMNRFWSAGLDFVKGHALAWHLSEHSSNRPLYGWVRRHREDPRIGRDLNMALVRAVDKKREKIVQLLLWAGANPRARVPNLEWTRYSAEDDEDDYHEDDDYSAIELAVSFDRGAMLPVLEPDPARDDFAALYAAADSVEVLEYLSKIEPPTDWTRAILHNLLRLDWPYGNRDAKACLDFIAFARWPPRIDHPRPMRGRPPLPAQARQRIGSAQPAPVVERPGVLRARVSLGATVLVLYGSCWLRGGVTSTENPRASSAYP